MDNSEVATAIFISLTAQRLLKGYEEKELKDDARNALLAADLFAETRQEHSKAKRDAAR